MAESPMVGTRIPLEWRDQIDKIARQTGRRSSQVIYEAIALYLDRDEAQTMSRQIGELGRRVELLEQHVSALRVLLSK